MVCPDGTRLASSIWTPEAGGPWPVLLMRQPYGRAIASTVTYAHPSWYARQGFLVVVQDIRGRGASDGLFSGFAQEACDGAAAMGWARRLKAGNGRVGTYGFSYQGLTQLLIEPPQHEKPAGAVGREPPVDPFPDCLAPAMCGLDERLHWASEGGAHWWALGVGWALQLAAEGCRRRQDADGWLEIRRSLENKAFLRDGLELLERHDPQGMGLSWLRSDPSNPAGWKVHPVATPLLRRPMLLIGGWHDPHLRGVLDLWHRSRAAGGRPWLRIGAWSHLDWRGGADAEQLVFFRRHLGGPPAEACPPDEPAAIELQCVTSGQWLQACAEELGKQTTGSGWGLHSEGLAAIRADEGALRPGSNGSGHVVLVHDPWRPVPGRGGHLGLESGVVERADLDGRADVACFTTAPLEQSLRLLGEPQLTITVGADQPGFDLCAALSVVDADGQRVRQLCGGVARFLGPDCRKQARRSLRLQPIHACLLPGERLRLSLAGAAWPQVAVNPGDGSQPLGGVGPGHRVITLSMGLASSRLWLGPLLGAN